jgi:hypothetical protein
MLAIMPTRAWAQAQDGVASSGEIGTQADCTLSFPAYISGGLTLAPQSATYTSSGETGSISCTGTIEGQRITGPGSFGFQGTLTEASCLSHKGSGHSSFTIPTESGPLHVSGGHFSDDGVGIFGTVDATHAGGVQFVGTYVLFPVKGNCVTEPVTEGRVEMRGTLRNEERPPIECDLDLGIVQVNCRSTS